MIALQKSAFREEDNMEAQTGVKSSPWFIAWHQFRKNKLAVAGALVLAAIILAVAFAPYITSAGYAETKYLDEVYSFPSLKHLFGVDMLGRDFFSRNLYAGRISLGIAFATALISGVVGVPLGAYSAYRGGWVDWVVSRVLEVMSVIPPLLLAILMGTLWGGSVWAIILIISATNWVIVARLVRGQVLSLKEEDYIIAARAMGAKEPRIIFRHLIPNCVGPIIVGMVLSMPTAIMTEAGLSFLGVGINPPVPSWGKMINEGLAYINFYWHFTLFPALLLGITILALSFVGDGFRDALDPKMKT